MEIELAAKLALDAAAKLVLDAQSTQVEAQIRKTPRLDKAIEKAKRGGLTKRMLAAGLATATSARRIAVTHRKSGALPAKPSTGLNRNDACPCGSGKKYKKCCRRNPTSAPHEASQVSVADRVTIRRQR